MNVQIKELATFLKVAPRTLCAELEESFDCHLETVFKIEDFDARGCTKAQNNLGGAKDEMLVLKSNNPRPPKWIDYNKPLVSPYGLFAIIMEWKKENPVYNFKALRYFVLARCFQPENPSVPDDVEVGEYLTRAFNYIDYEGDTAKRFNHFICDSLRNFKADSYYGATIPILQSSGTGKSRLASEMRGYWPTLSVCLRDPDANFKRGYPLCDQPVVKFFSDEAANNSKSNISVMAFISAWLDIACQGLKSINLDAPVKDIMAAWDLVPNPIVQGTGSGLPSSSSSSSSSVPINLQRCLLFQQVVESARAKKTKWNELRSKKRKIRGSSKDEALQEMARHFLAKPM